MVDNLRQVYAWYFSVNDTYLFYRKINENYIT